MSETSTVFYKLVHDRRSIRNYQDSPVSQDVIKRILKAAIRAPSAHNSQPWRFVILSDVELRKDLARRMGERLRADLEKDGIDLVEIQNKAQRSYERISHAPIAILVCMDREAMDSFPDEERSRAEYLMAVQAVAMAGENILLAALVEGLGACWICAPIFVPDLVQEALRLPSSWEPQAVISIGYPAEPGRDRSRRPIDEVSLWK